MARTWAICSGLRSTALSICLLLACQGEAQPETEGRTVVPNVRQEDMTSVVQAVLDAPALQAYLHPEVEGRVPLVLVTRMDLDDGLRKFDAPVHVTDAAPSDGTWLEITDVQPVSNGYAVAISYPVEGLTGRFEVSRDEEGRWIARRHELTES